MAQKFKIEASIRNSSPESIRRESAVPGVVYGYGLDNQNVSVDLIAFQKVLNSAGYTSLVSLVISGDKAEEHTVLIREVQTHPVRDNITHIDFYQPRLDKPIRAQVPLHFIGESEAVRDLGGVLVRPLEEVDLEALPANLPHDIEVDISILKDFETVIHVKDLSLPADVKLYHEDEEVVALVQPPRTEEELEADLTEEVTEDVESVEGVEDKPEEGEEGEESEDGEKPAETEEAPTEKS